MSPAQGTPPQYNCWVPQPPSSDPESPISERKARWAPGALVPTGRGSTRVGAVTWGSGPARLSSDASGRPESRFLCQSLRCKMLAAGSLVFFFPPTLQATQNTLRGWTRPFVPQLPPALRICDSFVPSWPLPGVSGPKGSPQLCPLYLTWPKPRAVAPWPEPPLFSWHWALGWRQILHICGWAQGEVIANSLTLTRDAFSKYIFNIPQPSPPPEFLSGRFSQMPAAFPAPPPAVSLLLPPTSGCPFLSDFLSQAVRPPSLSRAGLSCQPGPPSGQQAWDQAVLSPQSQPSPESLPPAWETISSRLDPRRFCFAAFTPVAVTEILPYICPAWALL